MAQSQVDGVLTFGRSVFSGSFSSWALHPPPHSPRLPTPPPVYGALLTLPPPLSYFVNKQTTTKCRETKCKSFLLPNHFVGWVLSEKCIVIYVAL